MKIEKKISSKKNIWKHIRTVLAIVTIVISFATMASANGDKFPNGTPLQNAIKQEMANGNFSESNIEGAPEYSIEVLEKNESHIKLKSTTKITFKNPRGAGYENNKWPKFEVKDDPELRKNGIIRPGDYDQAVKDYIASNIQNITDNRERTEKLAEWKEYDFESGPRTDIIEEIYEITYPKESQSLSSESTSNGVLMGFTRAPHISWIVEDRKTFLGFEIYYYKAGFELDAAYGLRLPTEVGLNMPALIIDKQNYILSTSINGADWDGVKYSSANVLPENGNEFIARFEYFLGVVVRIARVTIIDWHIEANRDYGRSFRTPIGSSESFPNLDLYLDPTQTGLTFGWSVAYLGIGLSINPDLSPDKVTADWSSTGDAIGNGMFGYYAAGTPYNFGPVYAGDYSLATDYANIRLSNFKYYFDQCRFVTDAFVRLHLGWTGFSKDWDFPINIYTLDCGGSYLGTHLGTNADSVNEYILVDRITVVSPNGGENWLGGATNTISWKPGNNAGQYVTIELLKGGVLYSTIAPTTPNDGSFDWIPTQTLGTDYKVRITSTSNSAYTDISDNDFTISSAPSIIVVSPNGRENWARGTTHTISWTSSGSTGTYVKIELFKSGLNQVISPSTLNDGSFSWAILSTQPLGTDYKVRVTSTSNSLYKDTSDGNFIISIPVNLLKNPGFETASGTIPQYWGKYQTGTRAIFTYPEIGRGGIGKSVAIKYPTKETGKVALWRQSGITVVPGGQYKLSGYMKLEGVTGGGTLPRYNGASLRVSWYKSDGGLIKTDLINKIGTSPWTKYEQIFSAPSNAIKATVGGDLYNAAGKVTFDDLSFIKIS